MAKTHRTPPPPPEPDSYIDAPNRSDIAIALSAFVLGVVIAMLILAVQYTRYKDEEASMAKTTKLLRDMTEPELNAHLSAQLKLIREHETPDTIGSMLVIFQEDGITQYGATIDPSTAPDALRELADRLERRETVKRGRLARTRR